MNEIKLFIYETIAVSIVLTVIIMFLLRLFFKKYGARMYNWYIYALDSKWFHATNVIIMAAMLGAFWYGVYKIFF
jgi:predicted membrane protein